MSSTITFAAYHHGNCGHAHKSAATAAKCLTSWQRGMARRHGQSVAADGVVRRSDGANREEWPQSEVDEMDQVLCGYSR